MKAGTRRSSLSFGMFLLAASCGSFAMPAVQTNDQGVEYVAGGIGQDESQQMNAAAAKWPLALEFAQRSGTGSGAQYLADIDVHIRDSRGHEVLATTADGPFLLARLAPGRYTVQATVQGDSLTQHVNIRKGHPARVTFIWPQGGAA